MMLHSIVYVITSIVLGGIALCCILIIISLLKPSSNDIRILNISPYYNKNIIKVKFNYRKESHYVLLTKSKWDKTLRRGFVKDFLLTIKHQWYSL